MSKITRRQTTELEISSAPGLGTRCPVAFGTGSRILKVSPALFVLSSIFGGNLLTFWLFFGQICLIVTIFWSILSDCQHFLVNFIHSLTNFELFLSAFISRFWVNRLGAQQAQNYFQVCLQQSKHCIEGCLSILYVLCVKLVFNATCLVLK